MIDFYEELAKFELSAEHEEFAALHNEAHQVIAALNTTLKRFGRELNDTNIQLEEMVSMHAEELKKDEVISEQQRAVLVAEEGKLLLVRGLTATLDLLEDIHRYARQNGHNGWTEQMELVWQKAAANIQLLGMTRIEGENTLFDSRLHAAEQTKENIELPNGLILEVLRSGYIYNTQVLRKAQVIVNTIKQMGWENYEQNRWY